MIQIYSGLTSDRVLDGELLYTEILEVNLFAFAYKLFHGDFSQIYEVQLFAFAYRLSHEDSSPIYEALCKSHFVNWREIVMKQSVGKCK